MKRIKQFRLICLVLTGLLTVKLFYLSVIKTDELSQSAVLQRTQNINIKSVRGIIYDRSMIPLTEGENRLHAAVFPDELEDKGEAEQLLGKGISYGSGVQIFPLDSVSDKQTRLITMRGISLFNVSERYNEAGLLSHVIGYTSDNGGFGIERIFNKALTVGETDSISLTQNAGNQIMSGLGHSKIINNTYRGVQLTVDYHVQSAVEKVLDDNIESGCAIVLDAVTGNVLAMASRPNFKQSELVKYLNGNRGELINRALSAYDIGSIFKIVLTAAALEEGLVTPGYEFECNGSVDIDGMEFPCNEKNGHGVITLADGLAKSCNAVYYGLGQKIGIDNIYKYAKEFGLGEPVLNIEKLNESAGYIPRFSYSSRELANISIGQGNVSVTPVQAADILCTIVNGGIRQQLSLVSGIVDDGGTAHTMMPTERGRVISKKTAQTLKDMLDSTVEYGTGTRAKIDDWGAGGKTGSAETGWATKDGTMTHAWFAGYFPKDNPRYVCVVMLENGRTGAGAAAPVFKEIGTEIKRLNR